MGLQIRLEAIRLEAILYFTHLCDSLSDWMLSSLDKISSRMSVSAMTYNIYNLLNVTLSIIQ
jgi:hypothetical protein